ncbi:hypothetical protein F5880DRAFT_1243873 [Lentinula raphanica]|nr:hypothetical protein F5880DRAFT_1243873 [Lentinula raphanica]
MTCPPFGDLVRVEDLETVIFGWRAIGFFSFTMGLGCGVLFYLCQFFVVGRWASSQCLVVHPSLQFIHSFISFARTVTLPLKIFTLRTVFARAASHCVVHTHSKVRLPPSFRPCTPSWLRITKFITVQTFASRPTFPWLNEIHSDKQAFLSYNSHQILAAKRLRRIDMKRRRSKLS